MLSAPEGSAALGGQLRLPLVSHRPLARTLPCPSLARGSALGSGVSLLCLNQEPDLLPAPSAGGFPTAPLLETSPPPS